MNKGIAKKACFIWVCIFLLQMVLPVNSTFAASAPPSAENHNDATRELLSVARSAGAEEIARLIREGADVNAADARGVTPLMLAAENNSNPETLRTLIENGADVNAAPDRLTQLTLSAMRGSNSEFLRVLIENGANVNAADNEGLTPLMWGIAGDNLTISPYRDGANAPVSRRTPLISAVMMNSNPEVLRILIENGADANAVFYGKTLLVWAAMRYSMNSNPEVLRVLVENGANVNATDRTGRSPLKLAAEYSRNPEVMQILIENGANVNAAGKDGETPLMLAAQWNDNPEVLRVLIENGANVNAADENGRTPLMFAAWWNNNPEVLRILIKNGAKVNATNKYGITALIIAKGNRNPEIQEVLIESGASRVMYWLYLAKNLVYENKSTTAFVLLCSTFLLLWWFYFRKSQNNSWLPFAVIELYIFRGLTLCFYASSNGGDILADSPRFVFVVVGGVIFFILAGMVFPNVENYQGRYRISGAIGACLPPAFSLGVIDVEFAILDALFVLLPSFAVSRWICYARGRRRKEETAAKSDRRAAPGVDQKTPPVGRLIWRDEDDSEK